jgi:signal transduction histidine kinase
LERKRAEDTLRELTSKLLKLRDEERRRLARELHDSVGQLLALLSINMSQIQADPSGLSEVASNLLSESIGYVRQICSDIGTISHLLHPPLLDLGGLKPALIFYVDGLWRRSGIETTLEVSPGLGRLPDDMELAIFRIVQECLTNVHRHSGSKSVAIRVLLSPVSVRVEVQDKGTGIPPGALHELKLFGSGVGIRGMGERVRQLGGTLEITSDTEGTLVVTSFPTTGGDAHVK